MPWFDDEFTVDETRIARDENGNSYTVEDMTYAEWKEKFVDGVDNGGESGIIESKQSKATISSSVQSGIEQRNTGKGNPSAIVHAGRPLNNRQAKLLKSLKEYDSSVVVRKKDVNLRDLSALTAHTGVEFAMFTKGQERLIVRGNSYSVNVGMEKAQELNCRGYRWSGHTHPGVNADFATPSQGDKDILKCFKQSTSVIYNSLGKYRTFGKE